MSVPLEKVMIKKGRTEWVQRYASIDHFIFSYRKSRSNKYNSLNFLDDHNSRGNIDIRSATVNFSNTNDQILST